MKTSSHLSQSAYSSASAPQNNLNTAINTAMGCTVLLLPIVLWLSVTTHRKHRASKLRRQIQKLESLWLLSSREPSV